ncbi:MAG: recombinase zinc beta ribbon domain-containing protein [Actinomycetota bacterium]
MRCGRCQSRLAYCVSRGNGGRYEYFFCLGQHERRTLCGLPHLPAAKVEEAMVQYWHTQRLEPEIRSLLAERLQADLEAHTAQAEQEKRCLTARVAELRQSRYKWAEKAMAGAVPDDIAREKQSHLAVQLQRAEEELARWQVDVERLRITLEQVLKLAKNCFEAYRQADTHGRRDWNQAWFEWIDVDVVDASGPSVTGATLTPIFAAVAHDREVVRGELEVIVPSESCEYPEPDLDNVSPRRQYKRTGAFSVGVGSRLRSLVGRQGLEPCPLD